MEDLNRINALCGMAKSLNLEWWYDCVVSANTFEKVEKALKILLPSDFVEITRRFPYHIMTSVFVFFEFDETLKTYDNQKSIEIIDCNLANRDEYKNFEKILVLADERDVDAILMFTQDDRQKPTPIIWCDYEDLYNYSETGEFKYKIDKWDSFTDFFEFLIEKEEEAIKEEKELAEAKTKLPPPKKSFWQRLFNK